MASDAKAAPRTKARIAGAAYLLTMILAPVAMFMRGQLIIREDAAQTAANILAHAGTYRVCFALDFLAGVAYLVVTVLLYSIFRPVSRTVALLALTMSVMGSAVGGAGLALQLLPFRLLDGEAYMNAFTPPQVQALALLSARMASVTLNVGIIFFGFYCVLTGYLLFRSRFFPNLLGAGMMLAGMGWLCFLYSPLPVAVFRVTEFTGFLGEGSLTCYLLFVGLNATQWHEQNALAHSRA